MPCRSDYMEASGKELESQRVCRFLIYIYGLQDAPCAEWIQKAANDYYGNRERLNEATALLCDCCRTMTQSERERIIYNAHDKTARDLACWFEKHQEWDKRRVEEEEGARAKAITKERALKKLTPEEMRALGLID